MEKGLTQHAVEDVTVPTPHISVMADMLQTINIHDAYRGGSRWRSGELTPDERGTFKAGDSGSDGENASTRTSEERKAEEFV